MLSRESVQLFEPELPLAALAASNHTKVGNSSGREQPVIALEQPLARRP